MGLERSGNLVVINARTIAPDGAGDVAYPVGEAQAGSIAVPRDSKGSITHVFVELTGGAAATAARITLFGGVTIGANFRWVFLGQLNTGGLLTPGMNGRIPVTSGNDLFYSEALLHISAPERLFPMVTGIAGGPTVAVSFGFENPGSPQTRTG